MTNVVTFSGEYDLSVHRKFHEELTRLYEEPAVILDFSEVSYIDSSCIAELVLLARHRREAGFEPATMVVAGAHIRKVLEVSGISKLFRIAASLAAAQGNRRNFVVGNAFDTIAG